MEQIVNVKDMERVDWLALRQEGIGGSDAAAVAGLSPWKSSLQVWIEKTGGVVDTPTSEAMRIGNDLEDYVAKRFAEASGKKVRRNNFMLRHPDYPWMIANIDREVVREKAVLECKTTGSYSAKDWEGDKIPPQYEIQCLHYLAVTGYDRAYIAVLIGNQSFVWKTIERDEEAIQALIQIERDFWLKNVIDGFPPAPDGTEAYSDMLKERFTEHQDSTIDFEGITPEDFEEYEETVELIDKLEEQVTAFEQKLRLQLRDNRYGVCKGWSVDWNRFKTNRFDSKRFQEENPELYEKYKKEGNSSRFIISREGQ